MHTTRSNDLEESGNLLAVLQEPNRLRILCLLKGGEQCVCVINESLGLSQHLVSHHLATLRDAGLVCVRREGRKMFYQRNEQKLRTAIRQLMVTLSV